MTLHHNAIQRLTDFIGKVEEPQKRTQAEQDVKALRDGIDKALANLHLAEIAIEFKGHEVTARRHALAKIRLAQRALKCEVTKPLYPSPCCSAESLAVPGLNGGNKMRCTMCSTEWLCETS